MNTITETLNTPVRGEYDVIVVGGGPAGCGAAIVAGRRGARVLLVEKMNCLGGMWTSGLVNPLFDAKEKDGLIIELIDRLKEKNAWGGFRGICFQYEYMKVLLEEMCADAGVDILYNTFFARTLREGNRVTGVVVENLSGRSAYLAHGVIDASADAVVATDAGVAFTVGDENGDCQSMTLMFLVSNVPEKFLNTNFMMYEQMERAYRLGGKTIPFEKPFLITIPNTDFAVIQFTHMRGYDPTDADAISRATTEGRRQMIEAIELLHTYDPDLSALNLVFSAPLLGVRESRQIVGEYKLSLDDLLEGRSFEDGIADVRFNVDIHNAKNTAQKLFNVKKYQIPYRALIPKGVEGLLVAGRCISGTHEAEASFRVTADCMAMGEATGGAMAYAVREKISVREVDVRALGLTKSTSESGQE